MLGCAFLKSVTQYPEPSKIPDRKSTNIVPGEHETYRTDVCIHSTYAMPNVRWQRKDLKIRIPLENTASLSDVLCTIIIPKIQYVALINRSEGSLLRLSLAIVEAD